MSFWSQTIEFLPILLQGLHLTLIVTVGTLVVSTVVGLFWGGRVALTRDFLPHLHEPEPGLLVDIGCMGRGIGLQSLMGQAMARYVETGDRRALPFPVVPIQPIPMHAMRRLYVSAIIAWYRMNDGGMKQAA